MKYTIGLCYDGITVRDYLRGELGLSRSAATRLKKRERGITVNGERVTVRKILRVGDILELDALDSEDEVNKLIQPVKLQFNILFEDDDIIAVDKPAGMPTHPSRGHRLNTLANAAAYYYAKRGKPFIFRAVNRLDLNTSGVVLLAKNKHAAYKLSCGISSCAGHNHNADKIEKEYFAILRGIINPAEPLRGVRYPTDDLYNNCCPRHADIIHTGERSGLRRSLCTIDAPVRRADSSIITREVSFDTDSSYAKTEFYVVGKLNYGHFGKMTAVRVFPQTGRTHQLRVHFSYIGYPVAGDTLYGRYANDADQPICRHALHCSAMTVRGIRIEAPLPDDLKRLLKLGNNNG